MDNEFVLKNTEENELLRFLGVKVLEAGPKKAVLQMEVTPRVHQYVGIMNGGVSVLLAETAASVGAVAASNLSQVTPVGVEINANHLRAVSRGIITVVATPISHGRTMSVWSIEITNDKGKLVCVSRITIYLQKRPATRPLE
ncbi:MAG TPA: PaaI family thioesterase [Pyrinomonadaceae bacterium]|jgi:uncharacterized protein (TIGR00369 family)|nr:PaaI family thioesterase [Pyrinomonadaceae bacterium]